jgi:hypothetical protein
MELVMDTADHARATLGSKQSTSKSAADGPHVHKLPGAPQLNRYVFLLPAECLLLGLVDLNPSSSATAIARFLPTLHSKASVGEKPKARLNTTHKCTFCVSTGHNAAKCPKHALYGVVLDYGEWEKKTTTLSRVECTRTETVHTTVPAAYGGNMATKHLCIHEYVLCFLCCISGWY